MPNYYIQKGNRADLHRSCFTTFFTPIKFSGCRILPNEPIKYSTQHHTTTNAHRGREGEREIEELLQRLG